MTDTVTSTPTPAPTPPPEKTRTGGSRLAAVLRLREFPVAPWSI